MIETNTLLQDRYLVTHLLGQGGMGAVYKAIDRKFGNTVALKETFYCDRRLREAFALEARMLNRLRHAALPVVTDYFSAGDSQQYLVMQYIPGHDLEQLLLERRARNQGVFPIAAVLRWADQLLDALDYLHSQGIIHRDIKPQNLKLTPRGEVILLDFGLAKGAASQDSSRSIRGYTPNYSPLEQIRGMGTDLRSDIYSVGATLYHLLHGAMPADAATRTAAVLICEPDPAPSLKIVNPEVPGEIASVIERAMSLSPEQRFASAAQMRMSLRNAGRSLAVRADSHRAKTITDEPVKNPRGDTIVLKLADSKKIAARAKSLDKLEAPTGMNSGKLPGKKSEERRSDQGAPPRRRSGLRTSGAVIAAGIIIFAIWGSGWASARRYLPSDAEGALVNIIDAAKSSLNSERVTESLRYYLEIESDDRVTRETGREPLADGSKFRFHFKPERSGYLYIIAPVAGGENNGVMINRVEAGIDFQVPYGDLWFQIESRYENAPFTIIFSPAQMKNLDFLSSAKGRSLTASERNELEAFKRDLSPFAPAIIPTEDDDQPAIAVQLPEKYSAYQPVVFGIDIKKK
jgi:serine/threonine protein kinase